ncbi:hypothetical protein LTR08_006631 [Meristemomyces frigidus]|nr:hypothetical protein LTR08_006631 [Meristemomyces frigidus]
MFTKKSSNPAKAFLDSVVDTSKATLNPPRSNSPATAQTTRQIAPQVAAPTPVHPVGLQRPSWIGPPRPNRPASPGVEAMKQSVTVEYASPGLQPPVYVFTSLSDPQWTALEMSSEKLGNGDYHFRKTFNVEEGEYQYKFRLGPGDWWALNESAPIVDDGVGNKNNLLVVTPPAVPIFLKHFTPTTPAQPLPPPAVKTSSESRSPNVTSHSVTMPPVPTLKLPHTEPHAATPASAPVMKHEAVSQSPTEVNEEQNNEPDYSYNGDEDPDEQDLDGPPLLRHESFAPSSAEQTQAPLLRHESMAIGEHRDDEVSSHLASPSSVHSSEGSVAPEADLNDPSLERFPTDQRGIFEHIHRVSTQVAENDDKEDDEKEDSRVRIALGDVPTPPLVSLPSVQEDDEELDELRDYEREKAMKEGMDSFAATVTVTDMDQRPAAPITPPMTPQEIGMIVETVLEVEQAEEIVEHAIEAKQAEVGGEEMTKDEAREFLRRENTVFEIEQQRGVLGTVASFMVHPMSWLAFAGVAVAVAAGMWKLR